MQRAGVVCTKILAGCLAAALCCVRLPRVLCCVQASQIPELEAAAMGAVAEMERLTKEAADAAARKAAMEAEAVKLQTKVRCCFGWCLLLCVLGV